MCVAAYVRTTSPNRPPKNEGRCKHEYSGVGQCFADALWVHKGERSYLSEAGLFLKTPVSTNPLDDPIRRRKDKRPGTRPIGQPPGGVPPHHTLRRPRISRRLAEEWCMRAHSSCQPGGQSWRGPKVGVHTHAAHSSHALGARKASTPDTHFSSTQNLGRGTRGKHSGQSLRRRRNSMTWLGFRRTCMHPALLVPEEARWRGLAGVEPTSTTFVCRTCASSMCLEYVPRASVHPERVPGVRAPSARPERACDQTQNGPLSRDPP